MNDLTTPAESSPPPTGRSFLLRTLLPWLLTGTIAGGGAWLGVVLHSDRVELDRRTEGIRREVEKVVMDGDGRLQRIREVESERARIVEIVHPVCEKSFRLSIRRLSLLDDVMLAVRDRDLQELTSTLGRTERIRTKQNRLLDRCRDRARDELNRPESD